jgi:hypothetical protein
LELALRIKEITMSPLVKGILIGAAGYWAVQHFTGKGTSGKGKS